MTTASVPRSLLPEAAALFNPAFGAYLLAAAAGAHHRAGNTPLPYLSSFLVLPLVLPPDSRTALPRDTRTSLTAWLARNPQLRASYPTRAAALTAYTRTCHRFALRQGTYGVDSTGIVLERRLPSLPRTGRHDETAQCTTAAALVGRWLAATPTATAFTLLGVTP